MADFSDALSIEDVEIATEAHLTEWRERAEGARKNLTEDDLAEGGEFREVAMPLASGVRFVLLKGTRELAGHYIPGADIRKPKVVEKAKRRRAAG